MSACGDARERAGSEATATEVEELRRALMVAQAQCQTHWELLRRIHDMIVVFDMKGGSWRVRESSGMIVFVSPACEPILGYRPEELYN